MIEFNGGIICSVSTWAEFKKYINGAYKELSIQFHEDGEGDITVYAMDWSTVYIHDLQNPADVSDFDNNYKSRSNEQEFQQVLIRTSDIVKIPKGKELGIKYNTSPSTITISEYPISFPYDVDCVSMELYYAGFEEGDYIEVIGESPNDAPVGALSANAASGQSDIYISSTALSYLRNGLFIKLGTDTYEYEISTIDSTLSKVTLKENLLSSFVTGDSIREYRKFIDSYWVTESRIKGIGDHIPEATGVPANSTIKFRYVHGSNPHSTGTIYVWFVYRY